MLQNTDYLKSTILLTIIFSLILIICPVKIYSFESIDSIKPELQAHDTTFQKEDLDTLEISENGFDSIVKDKFIEGPDLGMYFRLGILIVILYLGYRMVRKVFSNKT
ncbi:hypothetical protein [Aquiflexum gelatinilyticum]|uniref:Uncharacterized protein n=1 Tax=Aquiflexum gelatinilyticum TaxID=2961943 RepID=A0A9X2P5J8_9BACT|nr:hypothetical protein [Aquiflexum gelatinilyticum]MCR9013947.1 hypothetical protein [Aquiflexum gelatinilyticum]MCS4433358.1 hypothetical protein [Aquiflexum gelatinilyticum]